ncbi:hypothetical protein G7Z17_g2220 [Cylindrodendrum hubeiense]|uniref:Zn(2)-C6 fungal-type domain-containing protein n=1 Tax=Cylindrodendrum hubeiense TaxID=595255 RepID=A0A9P5LJB7_9HYPO|nr:hypothetical protein G7Z17_g2220 [Cylindrodendrum hubeiense]
MASSRVSPPDTPNAAGSSAAPPRAESAGRMRRPHRKSRRGCRPCKASRIKCDENQPICSNCARKEVSCDYFETVRPATEEPKQLMRIIPLRRNNLQDAPPAPSHSRPSSREPLSPPSPPSPPSPLGLSPAALASNCPSPVAIGTPADRLLELRLLHHYHTMSGLSHMSQRTWTLWTVEMAVASSSVMDAVLGFSAFHLRRLGDCDLLIRKASHKYMARAIRSHTEQLQTGLSQSNAAPMIAACALIMFHTTMNQDYLDAKAGPQLPLHWFYPFQSALSFLRVIWPWLQHTSIDRMVWSRLGPDVLTAHLSTLEGPNTFDFLLDNMDPECLLDEETMIAYRQAVSRLSYVYSAPAYRGLLQFPVSVTPRFVQLLEAQDPRTLAIVGYFFLLVKLACVLWWVDGAADREFAAIMAFLPQDWWPMMGWAIDEFKWSPRSLDDSPFDGLSPSDESSPIGYPDYAAIDQA